MINNMELKKKAAIAIKKNYCKCIFVPVLFILCLWLNNLFVNPIDQYSMFGKCPFQLQIFSHGLVCKSF